MPEERDERLNRELIELLNELRVALPGVQVLFAFLLVLPFQRRFGELARATAASTSPRSSVPRSPRRS